MKILSIRIPGRFEDAFIYRGHLLAITEEMSIRRYALNKLIENLYNEFPSGIPVLSHLFLRNDWLGNEQFQALLSNPKIAHTFLTLFDSLEALSVKSELNAPPQNEQALNLDARVVLDMDIYNDALYLGTDAGLYSSRIEVDNIKPVLMLNKRLDAPCLNTSARYGIIKASCGQDGLFAAIEQQGGIWGQTAVLDLIAPESLRTGWLDYDIVNYPAQNEPRLIKTTHEKRTSSRAYAPSNEGTTLTHIDNSETDLDYLLVALESKFNVPARRIQYTYNFLHHLFVQADDGTCYSISLSASTTEKVQTTHAKKYKHILSRILGVNTTRVGQVIETVDGVYLFAKNELIQLIDSGVLSVRTFGRSRRYKNIVLLTTENAILLMSVFDDSHYRVQNIDVADEFDSDPFGDSDPFEN